MNYINPSDLFPEIFFENHTEFDSLPEFRDALPADLDDVKDGDSVDPQTDEVVQAGSEFNSFQDLVDTALEALVYRNVDPSEFDIDDN